MTSGSALEAMEATATLQIRSHRRAHWFWCDNDLIDCHAQAIGPIGVALYVALARYVNHKTSQCWPSLVRLSAQLGITHLTARRYLHRLVERGLITMQHRPGCPALVTLLEMPRGLEDSVQAPDERGSLPGNEVRGQGSYATPEASLVPSYDVTKGSLCGNTEPDFPNQKKERTSETLQHVCDSPKTENPRPTLDRSEDVLTAIGTLSQTTREHLAEAARQSLIADGVAPWFLIRPVLEARMMALWHAQSPEVWVQAAEDVTTAGPRPTAPVAV